jgi:hypothetical protein
LKSGWVNLSWRWASSFFFLLGVAWLFSDLFKFHFEADWLVIAAATLSVIYVVISGSKTGHHD